MKKVLIILGIVVALCAAVIGGVALLVSNGTINISGNSVYTGPDGEVIYSFTYDKYLENISTFIDEFYVEVNTINLDNLPAENKEPVDAAKKIIDEMEAFFEQDNRVSGDGVEEFDASVKAWIASYEDILENKIDVLIGLKDNVGNIKNEDVDKYNQLITESNATTSELTDDINTILETFYNENQFDAKFQ